MSKKPSRLASGALATLGTVALLGLGGCTFINPTQTDVPYAVGDGVNHDLGAVKVRNLLVVSESKDKPAVVSGALVNDTAKAVNVTFQAPQGSPGQVTVEPGKSVNLTGVQLAGAGAIPGAVLALTVTTDADGAVKLTVPVLAPAAGGPLATFTPTDAPTAS